jgi:hypothetical protein
VLTDFLILLDPFEVEGPHLGGLYDLKYLYVYTLCLHIDVGVFLRSVFIPCLLVWSGSSAQYSGRRLSENQSMAKIKGFFFPSFVHLNHLACRSRHWCQSMIPKFSKVSSLLKKTIFS